MAIEIRSDDLRGPQVARLLQEHLDDMHRHSPPESVHALDLDALRRPEITFWVACEDEELLGCGALKQLSAEHGEIKSMRTANAHRGRGIAARLLGHILAEARRRGYRRLSLETGTPAAFDPARRLYARHGFVECGPFGDYVADPFSTFMTLELPRP
jgi:putative acetyltransferase